MENYYPCGHGSNFELTVAKHPFLINYELAYKYGGSCIYLEGSGFSDHEKYIDTEVHFRYS
jgi:hypothetical protein